MSVSRSFGSLNAKKAHLLSMHGLPGEVRDLRDDVETAFKAIEAEVDIITGPAIKHTVRAATTTALPANTRTGNDLEADVVGALGTIDGVTLVANVDYILVKNEGASDLKHGVYKVISLGSGGTKWKLTRSALLDTSGEMLPGILIMVTEGTANADTIWSLTTDAPIALNATALTFARATTSAATLASTAGAGLVGILDAGSFTATTTVEGALQEIYQSLKSATASKQVPILSSMIADGTPLAKWTNGASTTPGVTLADSKSVGVRWNNDASPAAFYTSFVLPDDIDITANAAIHVYASKVGATLADAVTFDVGLFNNAVGALHDADVNYGGTTSAMVGNSATKTVQKVTLALLAANLGVASDPVTLSIKPTDGTLGTDDVIIEAVELIYKRKVKTS